MEDTAKNNRYKNGKIYRLVNSVDNEFYVGSTCTSLAKRLYSHKKDAKRHMYRVYIHLNDIGWAFVSIVLVEEYPCANKMELERRERHWIEELKPSLNKIVPTRSKQEYREDNKEAIARADKQWYERNKEAIAERRKQHRSEHKETINEKQRQQYERNKEAERQRSKLYRERNKDAIQARRRDAKAKKKQEQQQVWHIYFCYKAPDILATVPSPPPCGGLICCVLSLRGRFAMSCDVLWRDRVVLLDRQISTIDRTPYPPLIWMTPRMFGFNYWNIIQEQSTAIKEPFKGSQGMPPDGLMGRGRGVIVRGQMFLYLIAQPPRSLSPPSSS